MNTDFMKGVIVPILTPIDENEWIDEIKMREQVDFVINGGVQWNTGLWKQRRILCDRRG